ncbi:MAG: prepilin-type N-terminal cleavage/methylation domain-containing protein [Desulfobacteraceae bacterium]|nr:prepilin-type N-terminal cleavage/methylation domain-containing protein [Desulfobacteraceae bacterium]
MAQPLNENGFTMIEVLVALAIFAIGMLGISAMQIQSTSANTTARISTEQTAFAGDLMEKLTSVSYDDLPDGSNVDLTPTQINNMTGVSFGSGNTTNDGRFTVECTLDQDDIIGDTKTLTLTVTDERRGGNRQLTLSYIIPRM